MEVHKSITYGLLVIIISSLSYFLGYGIIDHWGWFMWIAPLPILLFAFRSSSIAAVIVSFVSYFIANILICIYLKSSLPLFAKSIFPGYLSMATVIINAIIFSICILITRWVVLRLRFWPTIFIFPALWTCFEFFVSSLSAVGTNISIAYSQIHWLSLIQIASLTGIWGITFFLTLIPAGIAIAWFYRYSRTQALISVVLPIILLIISISWGFFRIYFYNNIMSPKIGLITVPETIQEMTSTQSKEVMTVVDRYLQAINDLANQGVQVILLPEKIVSIQPSYYSVVIDIFSKIAKEKNVTVILGFNQSEDKRNLAMIITTNGKELLKYYKPGNTLGLFFQYGNSMGLAINHDMDFQAIGRSYSKSGVGMLFVPALDFMADEWLHTRVAIMRGVEGGYAVARTAQWGLLSISDPVGRIIAIQTSSFEKPVAITGTTILGHGETFYARKGNWFPYICLIIAGILILVTSLRVYKRD